MCVFNVWYVINILLNCIVIWFGVVLICCLNKVIIVCVLFILGKFKLILLYNWILCFVIKLSLFIVVCLFLFFLVICK